MPMVRQPVAFRGRLDSFPHSRIQLMRCDRSVFNREVACQPAKKVKNMINYLCVKRNTEWIHTRYQATHAAKQVTAMCLAHEDPSRG